MHPLWGTNELYGFKAATHPRFTLSASGDPNKNNSEEDDDIEEDTAQPVNQKAPERKTRRDKGVKRPSPVDFLIGYESRQKESDEAKMA